MLNHDPKIWILKQKILILPISWQNDFRQKKKNLFPWEGKISLKETLLWEQPALLGEALRDMSATVPSVIPPDAGELQKLPSTFVLPLS